MQCTRPIQLKELLVPCGKCRACRIARAREWSVRIVHEMSYHECSSFVTLTYNDDNMPWDESIDKSELRAFIKRLRKRLKGRSLKYYGCGEYGEKYGRPHYHLILFNIGVKHKQDIQDCWNKGHIQLGSVSYDSARYVADYVQKDNRAEMYVTENGLLRAPPFSIMSQGIGKRFALDNREYIEQNLNITMYGVSVGIPRYYYKVLDIDKEKIVEKAIEKSNEIHDKHMDRAKRNENAFGYFDSVNMSRKQMEKNLEAKVNLKSKGRF